LNFADISRPTEDEAFSRIEAADRLRYAIACEPAIQDWEWRMWRAERIDPINIYAVAIEMSLPPTFVQRRLGIISAIFWLEELTRKE
jgi:hypothetical protein